ncbi:MAG: hypothetical protein M3O09_03150 [Acidobacteriota bacterium]|nr:hypothetical protein [Acidobacteriota bacterium]
MSDEFKTKLRHGERGNSDWHQRVRMLGRSTTVATFFFTLAMVFLPAPATADDWNKQTTVSFNREVEIPGSKVLPPGKYVFKLLDAGAHQTIVQVFSEDQRHIYATIEAIVKYRSEPSDKTVMTFAPRSAASPAAIRAWFYPGSNKGLEFVYPKQREVKVAKLPPTAPSSKPLALADKAGKGAHAGHKSHRMLAKKAPNKIGPPAASSVADIPEKTTSPTEITVWGPSTKTPLGLNNVAQGQPPESVAVPKDPSPSPEKQDSAREHYATNIIIGFGVLGIILLTFLGWLFKPAFLRTAAGAQVVSASPKPPNRVEDIGSKAA